jgi:hypothetical protein
MKNIQNLNLELVSGGSVFVSEKDDGTVAIKIGNSGILGVNSVVYQGINFTLEGYNSVEFGKKIPFYIEATGQGWKQIEYKLTPK